MTEMSTFVQSRGIDQTIANQLKSMIEKIEHLEEEKAELLKTIREVFAEAKSFGFDTKIIRQVLKLRKMKKEDVSEQEELLELYKQALGMSAVFLSR